MNRLRLALRAFLVCGSWLFAAAAFACTAISAPTTISVPGHYCLSQHIYVASLTGNGITVDADSVVLDLMGNAIVGPGSGSVGAGIAANGRSHVTVRGGNVSGFLYGVRIEGGTFPTVERMYVFDILFRGIRALGEGAVVGMNSIRSVRGTAAFPDSHSFGVEIGGPNCHARFNIIDEVYPHQGPFEGVGISVSSESTGCRVYFNTLRWLAKPAGGRILGVWGGGPDSLASVHGNVVLGADYGLFRWRATDLAKDNTVTQRCPLFWALPSTFSADNDVRVAGACTDPEAGF